MSSCLIASGVEVPQQTLPPGCYLHTSGCFDDCSSGKACDKSTIRTLPIGVVGCCQAGQDLAGQCPGTCGAKMCVNAATKNFKEQCPTATEENECPACEPAKLSLECELSAVFYASHPSATLTLLDRCNLHICKPVQLVLLPRSDCANICLALGNYKYSGRCSTQIYFC
eukprot:COSAG02_NODE_7781_length_2848_cov_7.058931_2_plen_169_part_00